MSGGGQKTWSFRKAPDSKVGRLNSHLLTTREIFRSSFYPISANISVTYERGSVKNARGRICILSTVFLITGGIRTEVDELYSFTFGTNNTYVYQLDWLVLHNYIIFNFLSSTNDQWTLKSFIFQKYCQSGAFFQNVLVYFLRKKKKKNWTTLTFFVQSASWGWSHFCTYNGLPK